MEFQKPNWYCQLCQRQCQNEIVYKQHVMTPSHQLQLLTFAEDPRMFIDKYSTAFEKGFLDVLKTQFGSERVSPTKVYQLYISAETYIHLNATCWETLTEFVNHVENLGRCLVYHRKKGRLLKHRPQIDANTKCIAGKRKFESDDDEDKWKMIEDGINAIAHTNTLPQETTASSDPPKEKHIKIRPKISMSLIKRQKTSDINVMMGDRVLQTVPPVPSTQTNKNKDVSTSSIHRETDRPRTAKESSRLKRKSALDTIIECEEREKEKYNRKDYWLYPGIIVKVITRKLSDKYLYKNAIVFQLTDEYTAMIQMINSGEVLHVDQEHVTTVLPSCKGHVRIVNGAYRNQVAILEEVVPHGCKVSICTGPFNGRVITGVDALDICKIYLTR